MRAHPQLTPGVRRVGPDQLIGGIPMRALRLSPAGCAALDALLTGRPHASAPALLGRLRSAGMVLVAPGAPRCHEVTVVVPVRGTVGDVQIVLAGVAPDVPLIVVDDGSPVPLQLAGVRVLRHDRSQGPAAARNAGAALAGTELIAFIDADVELSPGCLERLSGHFADERVVAAAPRVISRDAAGLVGVLEQQLCALDMGIEPAEIRRGGRVSYVPSTTLIVRRRALEALGGFDADLNVGEDVDLIWRLAEVGVVRYDPQVLVRHGARTELRAALRRRRDYGLSAAAIDRRHPGRVRHLELNVWSALSWVLALVHPVLGVAGAIGLVATAPRRLSALPPSEARRVAREGQQSSFGAVGRYLVRPAWPLAAVSMIASRRVRRLAPVLALAYAAGSWPRVRAGPRADLPARALLHLVDDLAYSAGVWRGVFNERRPSVLLPRVHL